MEEFTYIVKVDRWGKLKGYDAERMLRELSDQFGGSFVRITVTGWTQTPEQIRKWYHAGIIPSILSEMRALGNPVHPKSKEDKDWLHRELKEAHIPPLTDENNNLVLDENGSPIHTTKGLGLMGWHDYITEIQKFAMEQFGIELNPEKKRK